MARADRRQSCDNIEYPPPLGKCQELESRFQVRFPGIDFHCQLARFFLLALIIIFTLYSHGCPPCYVICRLIKPVHTSYPTTLPVSSIRYYQYCGFFLKHMTLFLRIALTLPTPAAEYRGGGIALELESPPLSCIFGRSRLYCTCISHVSHRILGFPLYPCIDLYLVIFQQIH